MPFTLIHHKNGKEIPIKMSIWDAFHGVPDPKPRKPKPCSCCGKTHAKKAIKGDAKKSDGKKVVSKEDGKGGPGGKNNSWSTSEPETFTAEDDAKILEMKMDKASWKAITEAIGKKSVSQVKERFKELERNTDKTDEQKVEEEKKQEDKKAVGEQKKEANLSKKEDEGKGVKKNKGKADAKEGQANEKKSKGNSEIKAWADGFERKKWIAVASKHYDKTGQRISPETARKMAEGK